MDPSSKSIQLLKSVARRMRITLFASRLEWWLIGCAVVYLLALTTSRLTGWYVEYFELYTLAIIPAVALIGALFTHRAPEPEDAARAIDKNLGSKDLFLTVAMLDNAPGVYQPIVAHQAESRASEVQPDKVITYQWQRGLSNVALATAILMLVLFFVPQLDPFGQVEASENEQKKKEQLADAKKSNALRKKNLEKVLEEQKNSPAKLALKNLKKSFDQMKPRDKEINKAKIDQHRKQVSDLWKKKMEKGVDQMLKQSSVKQQFGQMMNPKMQQWKKELSDGNTKGLQKELEDLKKLSDDIKKESDPEKRKKLEKELQKRLQNLSNFAKENLDNPQLNQALNNALMQMQAAQSGNNKSNDSKSANPQGNTPQNQALQDLAESLDLSKMELDKLGQQMKEMQNLEEALEALQQAQKLNKMGKLDGEACKECKGMKDYAEHFKSMCEGSGQGQGNKPGRGTGKRGLGGGTPEEDESTITNYKDEKDPTRLGAGKMLSIKTRGVSESGESKTDYAKTVQQLKEAAGEAIVKEQIPPSVRGAVQKYFDNIEKVAEPADESK